MGGKKPKYKSQKQKEKRKKYLKWSLSIVVIALIVGGLGFAVVTTWQAGLPGAEATTSTVEIYSFVDREVVGDFVQCSVNNSSKQF